MSYLNSPRLVFTGDFMADTSTVNNDVRHYDNTTFEPYFQEPSDPTNPNIMNGWWNPSGGSVFNFQNCVVQQLNFPDGSEQSISNGSDPVLGQLVGGPDGRATGKMIDMDPQWQMSSELWCVRLRIYSSKNEVLLSGEISVSGFRDLQMRQQNGGSVNGQPMGGGWTSVLTNVIWGDAASSSPFLMQLKQTTEDNTLSIQLNMYGFYYNHAPDGRFGMGKIIGSIGPWFAGDPKTFAPNRRLCGVMDWGQGATFLQYSNFLVDHDNARLTLDLGGSFPIQDSLGTITGTTEYSLGILKGSSNFINSKNTPVKYLSANDFLPIGKVNYTSGNTDWLDTTGGIVTFNSLTQTQLSLLADHQLVLVSPSTKKTGQFVMVCRETIDGLNLRADDINTRLEYSETANVHLYAYQWGKALKTNDMVSFTLQPKTQAFFGGQMKGPHTPKAAIPYINTPTSGISFPHLTPVIANGMCILPIRGNKIGTPRVYIDGQMYYISYQFQNNQPDPASYSMDAIYVNLRTYSKVPDAPTWDDVSDVLTQYGNVYPLMSKYVVDLGSETAVLSKKEIMLYAFTRDINDPVYMPANRDLSESKRLTIVKWLQNPLPGGKSTKEAISYKASAVDTTTTTLDESEAIKKVRALTEAKNGAIPFPSSHPSPFENL